MSTFTLKSIGAENAIEYYLNGVLLCRCSEWDKENVHMIPVLKAIRRWTPETYDWETAKSIWKNRVYSNYV